MNGTAFLRRARDLAPRLWIASVLASAAVAVGCAPSGYYRSTSSTLDSLLAVNTQMQRRLASLEKQAADTREAMSENRANSDSRLTELNQRMDVLQGQLEASGERFKGLALKMEKARERDTAPPPAADSTRPVDPLAGMDPEQAYKSAYADFQTGRYKLAKEAFAAYIQRFPDTEVSDDAQYYLGECSYNTGDFANAIMAYRAVIENYPKGDMVPKALLKAGMASTRIKDVAAANKYYLLVMQRYPKSDEARVAKERLNQNAKKRG